MIKVMFIFFILYKVHVMCVCTVYMYEYAKHLIWDPMMFGKNRLEIGECFSQEGTLYLL